MIEFIISCFWVIVLFSTIFCASGFALGHTYDYQYQRKTYNGSKTLLGVSILVVMYYFPWARFGLFNLTG